MTCRASVRPWRSELAKLWPFQHDTPPSAGPVRDLILCSFPPTPRLFHSPAPSVQWYTWWQQLSGQQHEFRYQCLHLGSAGPSLSAPSFLMVTAPASEGWWGGGWDRMCTCSQVPESCLLVVYRLLSLWVCSLSNQGLFWNSLVTTEYSNAWNEAWHIVGAQVLDNDS